jgi:hypothetical protein
MTSSILSGEDIEVLKIVTEKKRWWYPTTYGQQDGMLKQNSCFVARDGRKTFQQEEIMLKSDDLKLWFKRVMT